MREQIEYLVAVNKSSILFLSCFISSRLASIWACMNACLSWLVVLLWLKLFVGEVALNDELYGLGSLLYSLKVCGKDIDFSKSFLKGLLKGSVIVRGGEFIFNNTWQGQPLLLLLLMIMRCVSYDHSICVSSERIHMQQSFCSASDYEVYVNRIELCNFYCSETCCIGQEFRLQKIFIWNELTVTNVYFCMTMVFQIN